MRFLLTAILVAGFSAPCLAEEPPAKKRNGLPLGDAKLTAEAEQAASELRARFLAGSDTRAMLDSIVSEPDLGDHNGWFAASRARSRFDWDAAARRFDKNKDNRIEASEFDGSRADFTAADRNNDGVITESDFNWDDPDSPAMETAARLFGMADGDSNGKVTREEFGALFDRLKQDSDYLSVDELIRSLTSNPNASKPPAPLDRSMMVMSLAKQELGAFNPGPELNEAAPDFTLPLADGGSVTLSKLIGNKPIVLVFGTYTCRPFRGQAGNIEWLYSQYKDRADIYVVYVREAHPSDGWHMEVNESKGIHIPQPKNNDERRSVAQTCKSHLDLSVPMLIDTIDDQAGSAYSAMPNRLYIIDSRGKVAFKNGRGPFGFNLKQLEQSLVLLLNDTALSK
ncbi:MAG: deiodinase family protein [Pirellulales bacterium]